MTIGVLLGNVCTVHTDNLLNGLLHAIEGKDINTIFFMGAHANCFDELYYFDKESAGKDKKLFQYNTIFDFANLGKLDALIIAYSTFYLYMGESKQQFFSRFKNLNIPILIIGDEYEDLPCVISDNYDGIRKCMEHLINEHNCKKIAYLSGPKENNKDSKERLNAYIQVMNEYKLPIEDSMIEYGDYSQNSSLLFGKLIDNNKDLDAIVCANDTMAISGYEECKLRGLLPGKDIAITGFDNITEAKSVSPALTTVEQNTYDLGFLAMQKILSMIEDNDYTPVKAPVYFRHRESCGSSASELRSIASVNSSSNLETIISDYAKDIVDSSSLYISNISTDFSLLKTVESLLTHIFTEFISDEPSNYDLNFIKKTIRTVIESNKLNVSNFLFATGRKLTDAMVLNSNNNKKKIEIADLVLRIIDYTDTIIIVQTSNRIDTLQRNIWTTPFINREIISHYEDERRLYQCLMERIRFMTVDNAYLFLLPEPMDNESISTWQCPDKLNLVAKIENGIIQYSGGHTVLSTESGLADIITFDDAKNMASYTLFANNRIYGILVCQMTPDNITSMYSVAQHIGGAFQFIELTKSQKQIQEELEAAMKMLRSRNEILSMISEKDELTSLYNRRGFLENAIERVKDASGCYVLCIYADLDHLKEINDEFGHSEGDFAIKQAAKYLKESLRSTDIIGRIGGDEFAAIAVISREDLSTTICDRIATCSQTFNTISDKPYYIDLSIGYSVTKYSDNIELNKMLSAADFMLYENKKNRKASAKKQIL